MHIERLRVLNYKSFRDSDFIEFRPGFNVIVGQNNAGKSALLEALRLHMGENKPHRRRDVPADHPFDQQSRFDFNIFVDGVELIDALVRTEGVGYREKLERTRVALEAEKNAKVARVSCALTAIPGSEWKRSPDGSTFQPLYLSPIGSQLSQTEANYGKPCFHVFADPDRSQLAATLHRGFSGRVYAFKAERMM